MDSNGIRYTVDGFEAVIGLEVHAQLRTKSKLFCSCSTDVSEASNEATCPVCAGHPGALPVLNRKAVEFALKAALALNCQINFQSIFARKNYFYPDLPKGYQISQFDKPYALRGELLIDVGGTPQKPELAVSKKINLTRIHIEEDAGKSVHMSGYSLVNLNRSSTPLIEIVSEPDLRSPEEAGAYLRKLRAVLMYLDVCDGNMQEGNFRCDANVSVRPIGESKFGTRAEIKNVNSFRFVEKAIDYEVRRQVQVLRSGNKVVQETRTYDSARNITLSMRSKEEAMDYRYFPEPDLLPLQVNEQWVRKLKENLPELPDQKRLRYRNELGLSAYDSGVLTSSKELSQYFEEVVSITKDAKLSANWVMGEVLRLVKDVEGDVTQSVISAQDLGDLLALVQKQIISNSAAKTVFEELVQDRLLKSQSPSHKSLSPLEIVNKKGLGQVSDESALIQLVDSVLSEHPEQVGEYRSGKDKLFGFFVGVTMKKSSGKANPALLNKILKERLQK